MKKDNGSLKLITRVKVGDVSVEILADRYCYAVRYSTLKEMSYLPNIENCFQDIYDYSVKYRLTIGKEKELREIAKIVNDTKKEILSIMKPFVDIRNT